MKTALPIFLLLFLLVTGCRTAKPADGKKSAKAKSAFGPETVLVTYRVRSGSEAEFEQVLGQAWKIYRKERLVFAWPHTIVRDKQAEDGTGYVEIFTWVDHDAPDHPPESVKAIWAKMASLCEARAGHNGIEGGEVKVIQPSE